MSVNSIVQMFLTERAGDHDDLHIGGFFDANTCEQRFPCLARGQGEPLYGTAAIATLDSQKAGQLDHSIDKHLRVEPFEET